MTADGFLKRYRKIWIEQRPGRERHKRITMRKVKWNLIWFIPCAVFGYFEWSPKILAFIVVLGFITVDFVIGRSNRP